MYNTHTPSFSSCKWQIKLSHTVFLINLHNSQRYQGKISRTQRNIINMCFMPMWCGFIFVKKKWKKNKPPYTAFSHWFYFYNYSNKELSGLQIFEYTRPITWRYINWLIHAKCNSIATTKHHFIHICCYIETNVSIHVEIVIEFQVFHYLSD